MIAVKLVMFSAFDMNTFLPIARQAVGHGVSARADSEVIGTEAHNMMCVAGLVDGELEDVDQLYSAAYMIASDERDMPDIIQTAGMPHIWVDSQTRGIRVAILAGSIPEWRDAIRRGCSARTAIEVRKVFNRVATDLTQRSLDGILGKTVKRTQSDGTFLLEFKP